jgi:hypothetical protein
MELTLSAEEHEFLLNILEQRHQGLLKEIWHTDHQEFKKLLRENEKMLEALITRLRAASAEEIHS